MRVGTRVRLESPYAGQRFGRGGSGRLGAFIPNGAEGTIALERTTLVRWDVPAGILITEVPEHWLEEVK